MQLTSRLSTLTLRCDLDLGIDLTSSQERLCYLMSLITLYLGTRYDCLSVWYFTRYGNLFILYYLWPSPLTFSFCQFHVTIFDEKPYFMSTVMMDCRAPTLERRKLVKTWKNVLPVDAKVCRETYSKIMC